MTNCKNKGFTLIEVIVALLIFSISAGTIMLLVSQNFKSNRKAKNYIIADSAFYSALYKINKDKLIEEGEFKVDCDESEEIKCNVSISALNDKFNIGNDEIVVENDNYYMVKITVPVGEYKYVFNKIIEKQ